jgi:hypothetical protein
MLSLNAAYVATVGVCDALEHSQGHAAHFLHHSHADSDSLACEHKHADTDGTGKVASFGDHQHNHAHSGFATVLPNIIGVLPLTVGSTLFATPVATFVSAPQTLLDRPPRATLA